MKKMYNTPIIEELLLVDVLAESGDNLTDDSYDDGFGDEDDFFSLSETFGF